MKATSLALAAFVAMLVIGCSSNSNPTQADNQSALGGISKNGADDGTVGSGRDGNNNTETRIEGRVNDVNVAAGTVTIGSTVVQTNSSTKIERNDLHVPLSAIQVGDRGQARIPVGSTIASKVESEG